MDSPSGTPHLELAQRALAEYDLRVTGLAFIQHSENVTFQVEASQKTYLLRLHIPISINFGAHGADPAAVQAEMLWLEALRRSGLAVPPPVKTSRGDYVARVGQVNATLLAWQTGEILTREMESEETAASLGALVGRLHKHASQWKLPRGFIRPVYDPAHFERALNLLSPAVEDGRIAYNDFKTLQVCLEQLLQAGDSLRKTRKTFGLLHGDLHRGNFLLDAGEIRLIDFSMCVFGHYAFDLGMCLSNVRTPFHPVFLEQYQRHFPLSLDHERLIEGYFIAGYIVTFSLWVSDPDSQENFVQRVPYIAREYAARFLRDERFWFPL